MRFLIGLVLGALLTGACGGGAPSSPTSPSTTAADPISTFAAGDAYQTNAGSTFGGDGKRAIIDLAVAFTPSATTRLTSVEVAVSLGYPCIPVPGDTTGRCIPTASKNQLSVIVASEADGAPGAALETLTLAGAMTSPPSILTLTSAARPVLTGGTRYWLVVSLPGAGLNDYGAWNQCSTNATGLEAYRENGGAWTTGTGSLPAYRLRFGA